MKTKLLLLPYLSFFLLFISCEEEITEVQIKDPQAELENLKDSISFQLDGGTYIFDSPWRNGSGNAQVNLNSITDKGHPDSVLYWREFTLGNAEYKNVTIRFVKKYGKNQLLNNGLLSRPANALELYTKGVRPYAVDFQRFNTTDGITIDVNSIIHNSEIINLQTYLPESRRWLTSIGYDCQNNSSFEVTNLHKLPNGGYMLEAKFAANLFYFEHKITTDNKVMMEAKQMSIGNGYIRLRVK